MLKKRFFIVVSFFSLTLAGCGSVASNDKLDQNEVVEKVKEKEGKVKSVSQKLALTIENRLPQLQNTISQDFESTYLYGNEGVMTHIHTKQINQQNGMEQTLEFYKTPEEAYIFDGQNWQKHTGDENYNSTYKPVLDSFFEAAEKMEMTEEKETYLFQFKGKDEQVFKAVQPVFQINFNQADVSNLDLDIQFEIAKENMALTKANIGAANKMNEDQFSEIKGTMEFYDFDKTKEMEIPAEVKN